MAKEIHRTTPRRYVVEFFSDMGEWVPDSAFFTASEAISFAEDMAEGFAREYRVMDLEADDEGGPMAKEIYRVNPERYQVQYFDDQGGWVDDRAFPDPELAISWAEGSAPKYLVTYRVMDMEADE